MKNSIRLLNILFIVVLVAGCTSRMIALQDVENTHAINKTLTMEQVKESIEEGAKFAGWTVKELDADTLLATYKIRVHTVNVRIGYSESSYSLNYESSNEMKIYCTREDFVQKRGIQVSGMQYCPGDGPPYAIHKAYMTWVDDLNRDIQTALASS